MGGEGVGGEACGGCRTARTASLEVLATKVPASSVRCSSDSWTGMGAGTARDVVYLDGMDTRRLCEWEGRRERKNPIQTERQDGEGERERWRGKSNACGAGVGRWGCSVGALDLREKLKCAIILSKVLRTLYQNRSAKESVGSWKGSRSNTYASAFNGTPHP